MVSGIVITYFNIITATLAEPIQQALFKNAERPETKIIGGSPAARHQFPYQISIHLNGQHVCGASILTSHWVVTAGHCILGAASQMKVYAGLLHQRENHPDVQASRIARIIVHPYYRG